MHSSDAAARPVTLNGFNNADTWGNRGLLPVDDKYLFFGANSGFQYPTTPRSGPLRRAGWQLLQMTPDEADMGTSSR
jgi:hypothetical protein